VESVFQIIAEPNRRAILSLRVSSQQSMGEIERQLRTPQPTVSKHLRVLREAGFVESTVDTHSIVRLWFCPHGCRSDSLVVLLRYYCGSSESALHQRMC
jgi:predicted transcriptional regulator